ncbi:MAG TPA: hypothetical protein VFR03_18300 [Thermoanaerobaculia bacterium]|nr:hypothetical protein [Thermoanaerobaculia bacterium]
MVKKLFGLAVFALILAAFAGTSPASAAELPGAPAIAPSAGGCGQAPVLPAVKGETCSAAQPESVLPGVVAPSARLGYCHCGCSSQRTCHTSADCGGASCDQFISCC